MAVKIDIEGAEEGLLPRLVDTGAIKLVDVLLWECHLKLRGPPGKCQCAAWDRALKAAGVKAAFGLDMGGTSTDVAHYDAALGYERTYESVVAGVRVRAPMMDIHTVASGGGR